MRELQRYTKDLKQKTIIIMKYEKPDLEELELELEGSFLAPNSIPLDKDDGEDKDYQDWD